MKIAVFDKVHPAPCGRPLGLAATLLLGVMAAGGAAQAQVSSNSQTGGPKDESITWHGITLFGIVDLGLQYDTHGAPISDYFPAGSNDIIQSDGNRSVTGVAPSNISQSRIGLQGLEPIPNLGDWSGVFKLETFFNPQSGEISDGLKSLTVNNGRSTSSRTVGIDSSVAGQAFQQSYLGMSSPTFGIVTFGRQNTLLADAISKYDPNYASQAFSVIGLSGTAAGGGDTEDRRLNTSLKYSAVFENLIHFGAMYKFNQATGAADTAFQVDIGAEYAGLSVDGYYSKVKDAISAGLLSAAQVTQLPFLAQPVPAGTAAVPGSLGIPVSNALSATISTNTTFMLTGLYSLDLPGAPKFFAGYEHIEYANPSVGLPVGFTDIGGYKLAFVNNDAYADKKALEVFWAGVRYTPIDKLDLVAAYYGYHQNSYATGKNAGCTTNLAGSCSGTLDAVSFDADYKLTKRFDAYAGLMYSVVYDGLSNGYLNRINIDPTVGLRYKF